MRSGIGPARELAALGIDVMLDRPGVGKHLMEHPGRQLRLLAQAAARGCRSTLRRQMFAGLRWSSGFEDCPQGDMYLIPSNKAQWHAIGERLGLIMLWVNRSFSTGEVKLTSADPNAPLDIDFNMCSDPRDMERLVIGVRMMCRLQADAGGAGAGRAGVSDQPQRLGAQARGSFQAQRRPDLGRRDADGIVRRAAPLHARQADRRRALA